MGDYSVELCGGTHVKSTDVCQNFKVIGGGGIGAGVRRIEALASDKAAMDYENSIKLGEKVRMDFERTKKAEVAKRQAEQESRLSSIGDNVSITPLRDGLNWACRDYDGASTAELRALADALKNKLGNKEHIITVTAQHEKRVHLVVTRTDDVSISAVQLLKDSVAPFGGSGGGRDDFAQGGIPDGTKASELENELKKIITSYEGQ